MSAKLIQPQTVMPSDDDALRSSAAIFAASMIADIARRDGAVTPDAVASIRASVVDEIRARFFSRDVTPKDDPSGHEGEK